jgi:hypothetical protein
MREIIEQMRYLEKETEAYKKAFEQTSEIEIETRMKVAIEYVNALVHEYTKRTEIIAKMSPDTAKSLKFKLYGLHEAVLANISKDYQASPELRTMPEEQIKRMRNEYLTHVVSQSYKLPCQMIDLCLSACFETAERTKLDPFQEKDENISFLLSKHFPKSVLKYEGALESLESDMPDKFRHASASMRELIVEVLGNGSRARKLSLQKFSSSESENNLVEALANTVDEINETLNKGVHAELEEKMVLLSIRITENILLYFLEKTDMQKEK